MKKKETKVKKKTKNGICDQCLKECKGDGEPFDTEVLQCGWYEVKK